MKALTVRFLASIKGKKHHAFRRALSDHEITEVRTVITDPCLSYSRRASKRLALFLEAEQPILLESERISGLRTVTSFPGIFADGEWEKIQSGHFIHEQGRVCNVSPDYATTIRHGLEWQRTLANESIAKFRDCDPQTEYLQDVIECIDALEKFSEKYATAAEVAGNTEQAAILRKVPKYGAESFHEALQAFRLLHFTLWCAGNYHNTVGRFDQYMYPYYRKDIETGKLTREEALDLLEEFFISFNRDSDLYTGMQQGDNGQSMVLGGVDTEGRDCFNDLSRLCLEASLELGMIDPKINLRVHKGTDLALYELGTLLTRRGLGFPQYSNDDVAIPGLLDKGYDLTDARDYVVAACWEWIIPGYGMDIPNIGALSMAGIVNKTIREHLAESDNFPRLMESVRREVFRQAKEIAELHQNIFLEPSPFLSILMKGCVESGRDVSDGLKYNNYGLHGTGISTAVDSLLAVKKLVFEDNALSHSDFIEALKDNYKGREELIYKLRNETPKLGKDKEATETARELMDIFADAVAELQNERAGRYRAGTGSAMYYLWHASKLGATADGRKAEEPLPANFSPSLFLKGAGPLSVLHGFVLPNMKRVANGGPLTLELHDTVFRNDESVRKVAMLVKSFIDLGGHQLQLNAVKREDMLEAQKNPDSHRNLIVRVWGWSGYFVELDKQYQDQIIARTEYSL